MKSTPNQIKYLNCLSQYPAHGVLRLEFSMKVSFISVCIEVFILLCFEYNRGGQLGTSVKLDFATLIHLALTVCSSNTKC